MIKIRKQIEDILKNISQEPEAEARLIIETVSEQSLVEILRGDEIKNIEKIIEIAKLRAETGRPIQQILGFAFFMGEKFFINEFVLIPRDETEILVREVVFEAQKFKNPQILDIGTGSGCISCMIAKLLPDKDLQILGVDISTPALKVAIENVQMHVKANRVITRKSDVFSNVKGKFDIIVSNPPYIKRSEKLQKELVFEPQNALFAPENGLYFYKKIINEAPNFLNKGGYLLFEVGEGQARDIEPLLKNFSDIQTIKDMAGIERVIKAKF